MRDVKTRLSDENSIFLSVGRLKICSIHIDDVAIQLQKLTHRSCNSFAEETQKTTIKEPSSF
jgi:hypothetical protein